MKHRSASFRLTSRGVVATSAGSVAAVVLLVVVALAQARSQQVRALTSEAGLVAQGLAQTLSQIAAQLRDRRGVSDEEGTPGARSEALRATWGSVVPAVLVWQPRSGGLWNARPAGWATLEAGAAHDWLAALPQQHPGTSIGPPAKDAAGTPVLLLGVKDTTVGDGGSEALVRVAVIDIAALAKGVCGAAGRGGQRTVSIMMPGGGAWAIELDDGRVREVHVGDAVTAPVGPKAPATDGPRVVSGRTVPVPVGAETLYVTLSVPPGEAARSVRGLLLAALLAIVVVLLSGLGVALTLVQATRELGSTRDAVGHWRRLAESRQSIDRWQVLAEESSEPILLTAEDVVVAANQSAVDILCFGDRTALVGHSFGDYAAPEDRGSLAGRIVEVANGTRGRTTFPVALRSSSGERRSVEVSLIRVETTDGVRVRLSWRDRTSRERAEALLRAVASAVPVVVVLTDSEGRLVWGNERLAASSQYRTERLAGRRLLGLVTDADKRRAIAMVGRARRDGSAEGSLRVTKGSGEGALVSVRIAPVMVAGALFGYVVVAYEGGVSEDTLTGRFGGDDLMHELALTLVHRLGNDLQAAMGLVGSVAVEGESAPLVETARRLLARASRQLHAFGVLTSPERSPGRAVSLSELVEGWQSEARENAVARKLSFRHDGPDVAIQVNEAELCALFDLALAMAGPTVPSYEIVAEPAPAANRVRVMLPLPDVDESDSRGAVPARENIGTIRHSALLALARAVTGRRGGTAGRGGSAAVGYWIWCDFPIVPDHEVSRPRKREESSSGRRVLVADDEELIRSSLAAALRDEGFTVVEAVDGLDACERILADPGGFALAVLDLVMPRLDGREALRRIRMELPTLPVLVCTGYDPEEDAVLASAQILIKPFGIQAFLERVRELVDGGRTGPEAAE